MNLQMSEIGCVNYARFPNPVTYKSLVLYTAGYKATLHILIENTTVYNYRVKCIAI